MSPIVDAAIVGGGPAGLSAALWLSRYLRSVVLIDSGDPRNWETRGVNGFLGHPHIRPSELRGLGREEVRKYEHATLIDDSVCDVQKVDDECFHLQLDKGERIEARRLLLAYGLRDVWPKLEGLQQHYGDTAHVCPDCDGYEARDAKTIVIGSGRSAAAMALKLTTWTTYVSVYTNGEPAGLDEESAGKLAALGISVVETPLVRLCERSGHLRSLELADGEKIGCEHIFFNLGQAPADDIAYHLGCARDSHDQIVVDEQRHTSVRNVWAAGDLVPGPQLAVAAAADGAIAALSIHKSLTPDTHKLG